MPRCNQFDTLTILILFTSFRYDVLLDTPKGKGRANARNFWISVSTQYMHAGPAGYAVLKYTNAPRKMVLPPTLTPQPGVPAWTPEEVALVSDAQMYICSSLEVHLYTRWCCSVDT